MDEGDGGGVHEDENAEVVEGYEVEIEGFGVGHECVEAGGTFSRLEFVYPKLRPAVDGWIVGSKMAYLTEKTKQMATPMNHELQTKISVAEAMACRGGISVVKTW
jgi:hypothetical protein